MRAVSEPDYLISWIGGAASYPKFGVIFCVAWTMTVDVIRASLGGGRELVGGQERIRFAGESSDRPHRHIGQLECSGA
jgi:hypothetical protein